jgi:hypothetical protein
MDEEVVKRVEVGRSTSSLMAWLGTNLGKRRHGHTAPGESDSTGSKAGSPSSWLCRAANQITAKHILRFFLLSSLRAHKKVTDIVKKKEADFLVLL